MKLNDRQIALAKGMLARGDKQHAIAALFGVNGGRIAEIASGKVGADIEPARGRLPSVTVSPYELRYAINHAVADLSVAISALNSMPNQAQLGPTITLLDGIRGNLSDANAGNIVKRMKP